MVTTNGLPNEPLRKNTLKTPSVKCGSEPLPTRPTHSPENACEIRTAMASGSAIWTR